jgi:hypothetical protein
MAEVCKGLVVGGPLDGQIKEHTSNLMLVPCEGETVYRADGTEAAYQPNKTFRYVFVGRYWTPYNGGSVPAITVPLEVLEAYYMKGKENE